MLQGQWSSIAIEDAMTYVASPLLQQLLMRASFSHLAIFEVVNDVGILRQNNNHDQQVTNLIALQNSIPG